MDFQRDVITPNTAPQQPQHRPAPVAFDDMMGSLPPTRPVQRPVAQQPVALPTVPIQMQPPKKTQNRWLRPLINSGVAIILIILTAYLTYSWQHKKVISLDNQAVVFNKNISNQQQQIALLQETVPTLVPAASSYTGWTSYTLKNEKLNFQYPKSWKLVDSSASGSDKVSITSLNNFVITLNTGAASTLSTNSPKIVGFSSINFVGKFGYFDFSSTANDGLVEEATLSQSPTNALQTFPSKAAGIHPGAAGSFSVTAGYNSSGSNTGESQTLVNAEKDASYQTAELLIDSMAY